MSVKAISQDLFFWLAALFVVTAARGDWLWEWHGPALVASIILLLVREVGKAR